MLSEGAEARDMHDIKQIAQAAALQPAPLMAKDSRLYRVTGALEEVGGLREELNRQLPAAVLALAIQPHVQLPPPRRDRLRHHKSVSERSAGYRIIIRASGQAVINCSLELPYLAGGRQQHHVVTVSLQTCTGVLRACWGGLQMSVKIPLRAAIRP